MQKRDRCAVIVAHPDDETLWAGGTILMHPESEWTIVTLCRGNDVDRAPRFFKALEQFGADGAMGELDDGPEQRALAPETVAETVLALLPKRKYDVIFTHSTAGEYTRHLRHQETAHAVLSLWNTNRLFSSEVRNFAYEDGQQTYLPRAVARADVVVDLPEQVWRDKYDIITRIYGFSTDSFEARSTPRKEAFWRFRPIR
ncbi:MAG: PIG-L family deacetylase [Planctomycetota bacterium]|jgi:LmbE family N-acetylglucosaminyl deacetylase